MGKLSPPERVKFWDAVAKNGAWNAIERSNEEVKTAFTRLPGDKGKRFCQAITKEWFVAPTTNYLAEALKIHYDILSQIAQQLLEDDTHENIKAKAPMRADEFHELLRCAFTYYNKTGSGTLSPDEAKLFFSEFSFETTRLSIAMMEDVNEHHVNIALKSIPEADTMKRELFRKTFAEMRETERQAMKDLHNEYIANKAARDASAFLLCDSAGLGTLNWT